MNSVPILGAVVLQGFEVPERISLGGRQQLAVHELPGGGRVIDVVGADERPIVWSGVFSGQDAAARVRSLELMRRSGETWPLSWDAWRYTVIIQDFNAEIVNQWWIPYRVTLFVVPSVIVNTVDQVIAASSVAELADISNVAVLDGQIAAAASTLTATTTTLGDAALASGQLASLISARAFAGNKL